jgi:hypothetical protein
MEADPTLFKLLLFTTTIHLSSNHNDAIQRQSNTELEIFVPKKQQIKLEVVKINSLRLKN